MLKKMLRIAGVAAVAAGCHSQEKVAAPPPPEPASTTTITSTPVEKTTPVSPSIAVSKDIAEECRLQFDNTDQAPKFEFDKSDLLPQDRDVLAKLADCVTTGPLKGQSLELVGRCDPRGSVEYNMSLGARRAHSVATYLEGLGVSTDSIRESSRGKLDATGTDEATWAIDRRTDVLLAK